MIWYTFFQDASLQLKVYGRLHAVRASSGCNAVVRSRLRQQHFRTQAKKAWAVRILRAASLPNKPMTRALLHSGHL